MYMNRKGIVFGFKDAHSTWGLTKIIHAWLVNFKTTAEKVDKEGGTYGVPHAYFPLSNEEVANCTKEEWEAACNKGFELWMADLDKMIFAFDVKNAYEFEKEIHDRVEEGRALFAKMYADLWW
ncbi:MAG: hypothetical protein ACRDCE_05920 [Cetobacterium sp.]|uniref:hypothetical protein n=1 Tax=Cetobacterium sp. TaxID=2071632 RepID=UPI003EE7C3E8